MHKQGNGWVDTGMRTEDRLTVRQTLIRKHQMFTTQVQTTFFFFFLNNASMYLMHLVNVKTNTRCMAYRDLPVVKNTMTTPQS